MEAHSRTDPIVDLPHTEEGSSGARSAARASSAAQDTAAAGDLTPPDINEVARRIAAATVDEDPDDPEDWPPEPDPRPRPDRIAVCLLLEAVLAPLPDFRRMIANPSVVVIEVPDASYVLPVRDGIQSAYARESGAVQDGDRIRTGSDSRRATPWLLVLFARDGSSSQHNRRHGNAELAVALGLGSPVIGIAAAPERHLPADLLRAADLRLTVPPLDGAVVGTIIARITGEPPQQPLSDALCRSLSLGDLCLVIRRGSGAADCLARLERIASAKAGGDDAAGPTLADLHGYDEARIWGEALARDLQEYRIGRLPWSHVDRGALLVGPPGVGKTLFAAALARTCAVPLIVGGLSKWQAAGSGHLGDLLKAMQATFDSARKQAPCILLIDEADSFGDRAQFDNYHRDYSTQVVNALLEELDGIGGRAGVIVLGATNYAERIDPAIRRSGRLDRTLRLTLPGVEALRGILRFHLGADLADADLLPAALACRGGSGADVARWVRTARQVARHAQRADTVDDLLAAIRGGDAPLPPGERRRIAVHEAGHAVAVCLGGVDTVRWISLVGRGAVVGDTALRAGSGTTRSDMRRRLCAMLAGRAAEAVFFGEPSTGAGGGRDSDLGQATLVAAAMDASFGLGQSGPVWRAPPEARTLVDLLLRDPALAQRVSATLDAAWREAVGLVGRHRGLVEQVAERLLADGYVEGEALTAMVGEHSAAGRRWTMSVPEPLRRGWECVAGLGGAFQPSHGSAARRRRRGLRTWRRR